jgi:hypothetical protein
MADANGHAGHKPDARTEREREAERMVEDHIRNCSAAYLGRLKLKLTAIQRERRGVRVQHPGG